MSEVEYRSYFKNKLLQVPFLLMNLMFFNQTNLEDKSEGYSKSLEKKTKIDKLACLSHEVQAKLESAGA